MERVEETGCGPGRVPGRFGLAGPGKAVLDLPLGQVTGLPGPRSLGAGVGNGALVPRALFVLVRLGGNVGEVRVVECPVRRLRLRSVLTSQGVALRRPFAHAGARAWGSRVGRRALRGPGSRVLTAGLRGSGAFPVPVAQYLRAEQHGHR